jgi:hypothetical protein
MNTLETTSDWFKYYEQLQNEARNKIKEIDPYDNQDFMLNEGCDILADADMMMRMLCKRTQTLIKRIDKMKISNATNQAEAKPIE